MTDDPGFIDDDAPAQPAKPAGGGSADPFANESVDVGATPPKPAKPTGAADPFAGEQVDASAAAAAATPPAGKPATQSSAGNPFDEEVVDTGPGSARPADAADEDVKPGSGKNLWVCPHCGAKNKPNRDTCRSCGKSPDEAVAKPVWQHPAVLGVAGGAIALLLIVFVVFGGTDLSLKRAVAAQIDADIRIGGEGISQEVAGQRFTAAGGIAACGRVLEVGRSTLGDGLVVHHVFVVCGSEVAIRDPEFMSRFATEILDHRLDCRLDGKPAPRGAVDYAMLHLLDADGTLVVQPDQLLSFTGSYGSLAGWQPNDQPRNNEYVVLPKPGKVLTGSP